MITRYYKTDDPIVMAAWRQVLADRAILKADIEAFAARFGGEGRAYANPARFAGLQFSEPAPRSHWTARDATGLQRPKAKPPSGASRAVRDAHAELLAEWEQRPLAQVSNDPIFRSLGYTNDLDFILSGLHMFARGEYVYVATTKAMPALTEILGIEFGRAEEASP